jgi:hypothetical protein
MSTGDRFLPWAARAGIACAAMTAAPAALGQAQVPPPFVPPPMMASAPPNHLAVGTQYYEASGGGLRDYLEAVRTERPNVYAKLDPEVSSLETRSTIATISLVTGIVALPVGLFVPLAILEDCDASSPEFDACSDRNANRLMIGILGGLGTIVVGTATFFIVRPGRRQILDVVNRHNRIEPTNPIRFSLGYQPNQQRAYAALELDFDLAD